MRKGNEPEVARARTAFLSLRRRLAMCQYLLLRLFGGTRRRRFSADYFEARFLTPDPWGFEWREYERLKYLQTLEALPAYSFRRILEVGCAEGLFTQQLAGRADYVLGLDISERALKRARTRCARLPGVEFRKFDLLAEELDSRFDLVICSEILCFAETVSDLEAVCRKVALWAEPGGYVLLVHLRVRHEHAGGWQADDLPFGADHIHRSFGTISGLAATSERWEDLYAISLFRKS